MIKMTVRGIPGQKMSQSYHPRCLVVVNEIIFNRLGEWKTVRFLSLGDF
jgi:hypothetical protein